MLRRYSTAFVFALVILACSSHDDDRGCDLRTSCKVDADCAGYTGLFLGEPAAACMLAPTCSGGFCKDNFAPQGKRLADDGRGDCLRPQCDGSGFVDQVFDPGDVPSKLPGGASLGECQAVQCNKDLEYAVAINLDDGTPCSHGVCQSGKCVDVEVHPDAGSEDAGSDADVVVDAATD